MNLKINKKLFEDALKKLIIEKTQYFNMINAVRLTTKYKPAQSFIEFDDDLKPGVLTIESFYLTNRIHTKIEIDCEIDEECVIVIDKKTLIQKISSSPKNKIITLIFDENGYTTNTLQYKPETFIEIENIQEYEPLFSIEIEKDIFFKILEYTDKNGNVLNENKFDLKGPLFEFNVDDLKLVSTDGHILIVENFSLSNQKEFSFVFPIDIISKIKTIKNCSAKISVFEIPKENLQKPDDIYKISFEFGNATYEFDTNNKFPNYNAIIPPSRNIKLVLDKNLFSNILNKFAGTEYGKYGLKKTLCFHLNKDFLQVDYEHFNVEQLYNAIDKNGEWEYDVEEGKTFQDTRYCRCPFVDWNGQVVPEKYDSKRKTVSIIPYTKHDTFVCDNYSIELISTLEDVLDVDYKNVYEFKHQDGCITMKMPIVEKEFSIPQNEFFNDENPYRMLFNMRLMNQCLDNIEGELVEISTNFEITMDYSKNPPTKEINQNAMKIKEHESDKKICLLMPLGL